EDGESRVTEPAGELEWPDAFLLDDRVGADVSAVPALAKNRSEPTECCIEECFRSAIGDDCSHFTCELSYIARKKALVFPVQIWRIEKLLTVEECSDSRFDAVDVFHQDVVGFFVESPAGMRRSQERDHVACSVHLSDVVARGCPVVSVQLEDVTRREFPEKLDPLIKR